MSIKLRAFFTILFVLLKIQIFSSEQFIDLELKHWDTEVIKMNNNLGAVTNYQKVIKTSIFTLDVKTDNKVLYLITNNHIGFSKVYLNGELLGTIGSVTNIQDKTSATNSALMIVDFKTMESSVNKIKIETYSIIYKNNMTHRISSYIKIPFYIQFKHKIKSTIPIAFFLLTFLCLIFFISTYDKDKKKFAYNYIQSLIFFMIYFLLSGLDGTSILVNPLLKFSGLFYIFSWLIFIRFYLNRNQIWDLKKVSMVGFILITSVLSITIVSQYNFLFAGFGITNSIMVTIIISLFLLTLLKNPQEDEKVFRIGVIISLILHFTEIIMSLFVAESFFIFSQFSAITIIVCINIVLLREFGLKLQKADDYSKKLLESVDKIKKDVIKRDLTISDLKSQNEVISRDKSMFFTTLSNNLRTPLNSIIGYSENLYSAESLNEVHTTVNDIIVESDKIFQAINNVMDFSTREFTSNELLLKDFRMKEIFTNSMFESSILTTFSKNIKYTAIGDCDKAIISGNPIIYKQILTNVLHFLIELYPQKIDFTIYDTGITEDHMNLGVKITAKELRNTELSQISTIGNYREIFTKYIKLYNISFVENIGENNYTIELKFQCGLSKTRNKTTGKSEDSSFILDKQLKVMVVEDYRPNLNIVKMHLQKMGCDVITATNGEEAVEEFKKQAIDVILMDIKMPIMDGWEATEIIRSSKEGLDTYIIGLTASSLDLDIRHCFESGMDDVQVKPIRKKQLFNKLKTLHKLKPVTFPTIGSLRAELCVSKIETEALYTASVNQIDKQIEVLEVLLSAEDDDGIDKEMPAILHASLNINAFYFSRLLRNFFVSYKDGNSERSKELLKRLKQIIMEAKELYANLFGN